jgi:hypothetical protein
MNMNATIENKNIPALTTGEGPVDTAAWRKIVVRYQQPSWWRAVWQLGNTLVPYAALWYLMYICAAVSYWLVVPLAILAGGFMVRLFIIHHDCGHGSFFKSHRANDVWGFITGVLTLTLYGPGTVSFGDETSAQTTVSASLPGEYLLRLSAWDDGQSSFREVVWSVAPAEGPDPTALEQWREDQFGHLADGVDHPDAALLADPDGDGIVNLLEFALGGNPFIPHTAQVPESAFMEIGGERYLTLSASRNPDATDFVFTVEVSNDLADWRGALGDDVVILTDTPSLLEVRSAQPIGPGAPQFLRLRVVKTE